jgi:hypothetical protein
MKYLIVYTLGIVINLIILLTTFILNTLSLIWNLKLDDSISKVFSNTVDTLVLLITDKDFNSELIATPFLISLGLTCGVIEITE